VKNSFYFSQGPQAFLRSVSAQHLQTYANSAAYLLNYDPSSLQQATDQHPPDLTSGNQRSDESPLRGS